MYRAACEGGNTPVLLDKKQSRALKFCLKAAEGRIENRELAMSQKA